MSQERLSMKKLREILRLHFECKLSNRKIGRALKISPSTVGYYLQAAQQCELHWSESQLLNNESLQKKLEPFCKQLKLSHDKSTIDLNYVHQQLKQKGVTRELLWKEYQTQASGQAVSYTEFCRRYREFKKQLKPSMRQTHVAGEKAFVDYAGPTIPIYDRASGEIIKAVIFVGVLGASNYTYAEATASRSLPDWIESHIHMYEYFGGVPAVTVPDNEKSGVHRACYYDPEINPQYAALAAHYNTVILPTRPYKPKDKAKVEIAVQVVERWILAKLRHQQFFTLRELNEAILKLLQELNQRPFKKLPGSRQSLFETLDRPQLKALPSQRYEYAEIKYAQVRLDYHVEINRHFYSVPHQYCGKRIEYHLGKNTINIFYDSQSIASHLRNDEAGKCTTVIEHMPHAHRQHHQWSPQQFAEWSKTVGISAQEIADYLIQHKPNPECCYRIHLGFMNLAKRYGKPRLEKACHYARRHHLHSFHHVRSILKTQIDQIPENAFNDDTYKKSTHQHVRGSHYYSTLKEKI